MQTDRAVRLSLVTAIAAAAAACSKAEKPAEQAATPPPAPPVVHVAATDYAFQAPDTVAAGQVTFHLMNQGKELHHIVLLRLAEGQTPADLMKLNPAAPMPAGMVFAGGPNPAAPGGTAEATVALQPGRYVMFCVIPGPDGMPHMMKGMMRELVVAAGGTEAAAPQADMTIKMSDYAYEPSTPITAGHHVIRVENAGPQPHEMVLLKLEPGKTMADFAQWAEKVQGPPPGTPFPGVSPLSAGESNTISVDFTPGEYGFICFVTDSKDQKPHAVHGMVKQFTVQ